MRVLVTFTFLAFASCGIEARISALKTPKSDNEYSSNFEVLESSSERAEPPNPPVNDNTNIISPPQTVTAYFSNPMDEPQEFIAYDLLPQRAQILDFQVVLVDSSNSSFFQGRTPVEQAFLQRVEEGKYTGAKYARSNRRLRPEDTRLEEPILHQEEGMIFKAMPHSVYYMSIKFVEEIETTIQQAQFKGLYSTVLGFNVGPQSSAIEGLALSPNYPNDYPDNSNIRYQIHITLQHGYTLQFELTELDTESCCDKLYVFKGRNDSGQILGVYSGQLSDIESPIINTKSQDILVRFETDCAVHKGRYAFTYSTAVAKATPECSSNVDISGSSGYFSSAGYPNDYPENADCSWTITTDQGFYVSLFIKDLDFLEDGAVSVYDIFSNSVALLKTLSTSDVSSYVNGSITNVMQVTLTTGFHDLPYRGFYFTYKSIKQPDPCVEGIVVPTVIESGVITSPNYPQAYGNNRVCTWTLNGGSNAGFSIRVTDLDTETGYDHLVIYDGADVLNGKEIADLTGTQLSNGYYATKSNNAIVQFVSDFSVDNHRGFSMEVNTYTAVTECATTDIDATQGYITTPGYPNNLQSFLHCQYTIQVTDGYIVNLVLADLDIAFETDSLRIHDGPSTSDTLLFPTNIQSQLTHQTMTSTTSNVLVTFESGEHFATDYRGFSLRFNEYDIMGDYAETIDLNMSQGEITSPSYPARYPAPMTASWLIRVARNAQVGLFVKKFSLGNGDSLKVYNGDSNQSPLLYTCQGSSCKVDNSTGNTMYLEFDGKNSASGFAINYYTSIMSCAGSDIPINEREGYITSPYMPFGYNFLDCSYEIIIINPNAGGITSDIIQFDLQGLNTEPCCDILTIYDGLLPNEDKILYRGSGTKPGETFFSNTNEALVQWKADVLDSREGWSLHWIAVPEKVIGGGEEGSGSIEAECKVTDMLTETQKGVIASPGFPNDPYNNGEDTCWFFLFPQKYLVISFLFPEFHTEAYYDYLNIYRGLDFDDSKLEETLWGDFLEGIEVIIAGNEATLKFHSDGSLTDRGFSFIYEARL